mgnify:CR=1 FL=1
MKIKAGNDERVWLFFRNIILIGGLLLILCPLLDGADQLI